MTKAGLMKLVGKKVKIIFTGGEVEEGVLARDKNGKVIGRLRW